MSEKNDFYPENQIITPDSSCIHLPYSTVLGLLFTRYTPNKITTIQIKC